VGVSVNTNLSERERLIQAELRNVLSRELDVKALAEAGASGRFPRNLWTALAEAGWFAIGCKRDPDSGSLPDDSDAAASWSLDFGIVATSRVWAVSLVGCGLHPPLSAKRLFRALKQAATILEESGFTLA
jgi:alkylation response protein AidB-like acyl-CoA dehydrogenase